MIQDLYFNVHNRFLLEHNHGENGGVNYLQYFETGSLYVVPVRPKLPVYPRLALDLGSSCLSLQGRDYRHTSPHPAPARVFNRVQPAFPSGPQSEVDRQRVREGQEAHPKLPGYDPCVRFLSAKEEKDSLIWGKGWVG